MSKPPNKLVGTDHIHVTPGEAVKLMTHHLMLAHIYYQPSPDGPKTCAEMVRIMEAKGCTEGEVRAHKIWLAGMDQYYAKLRQEQGP